MSTELIQSSVYLTREQKEFVKENFINLSKVCRHSVDALRKKRTGYSLETQPAHESQTGDSTNG